MPNNRVFYASHSAALAPHSPILNWNTGSLIRGCQSVSMAANFNLSQLFELGHISLYDQPELLPDLEVTIQKVLDGHCPAYLLATSGATNPTLAGRSAARCNFGLAIYPDTNTYASGTPLAIAACSGMYANSVSYTFSQDGAFTEDLSLVGNDRIWTLAPGTATGTPDYGEADQVTLPSINWAAHMPNTHVPRSIAGVSLSQEFNFELPTGALSADSNGAVNHPDVTVMPREIYGITLSGTNPKTNGEKYDANLATVTVSTSFNRENINQLGKRGPYFRSITFPVECTCEITATSDLGDNVSFLSDGIFGTGVGACSTDRTNLKNQTIRIVTCDGLRLYLGTKNKLSSVNYAGGDAGGGNVTTTHSYTNFNDLTVMHINDVHASGSGWWAQRATNRYLTE